MYNSFMRSMYILFFISFVIAVAILIACLVFIFYPTRGGWNDYDYAQLVFPNGTILAEVASSTIKQYRGLSGHAPLQENTGMLFVFGHADTYPFIMRGMTFNLDFIWIDQNRVIEVDSNIPAPALGKDPEIVIPKVPVMMVLEIPSGTIDRLHISIGDQVSITKKEG